MEPSLTSISVFALLGLGVVFGLKHAAEVDHVVAVSTIVSEHKRVWRSVLVGGLWGLGHTAALIVVGFAVLVFRIAIPITVTRWLEFGVALMIITLGVTAVLRVLRKRVDVHLHRHSHDGQSHVHLHFHDSAAEHAGNTSSHSHAISQIGFKPLLVGAVHGLAGSSALTLLVLTQIHSVMLGLLYLALFGLGSTLAMLAMSGLIGLPFALGARRLSRVSFGLQAIAGGLSIAFGLWYAYEAGVANNLWQTIL